MKSRLTEELKHESVIVKHGATEIECGSDAEAIEVIKKMGFTDADIISPNGSHYHVTEHMPIDEN
jgi:hypothetical protein